MVRAGSRRVLLLSIVVAIALGFLLGWLARVWTAPSLESRARDATEELRERARQLTR